MKSLNPLSRSTKTLWEEDGDEAAEEAAAEAIDSDAEPDSLDAGDRMNPAEAIEKYANTEEDLRSSSSSSGSHR